MTLTGTDLDGDTICYAPQLYGAEPLDPLSCRIMFCQSSHPPFRLPDLFNVLELNYIKRESSSDGIIHDTHKGPAFVLRTVAQDLHLKSADWHVNKSEKDELPRSWLDLLGESIHVSATLRKNFDSPNPPPPEIWASCHSFLQTLSVAFSDLNLPRSKSLLRLFAPEVTESEPSA